MTKPKLVDIELNVPWSRYDRLTGEWTACEGFPYQVAFPIASRNSLIDWANENFQDEFVAFHCEWSKESRTVFCMRNSADAILLKLTVMPCTNEFFELG